MKACLFVRAASMPYIRRLITAFHHTMCEVYGADTALVVGDAVDQAKTEDAEIIFVVGEGLARFSRRAGRRYVYLNFSVVTFLGNPLNTSLGGVRLILHKRRLLYDKFDLFDAVLDYYPAQTRHLQGRLGVPVFGFLPTIAPAQVPPLPLADRPYDVCFVGSRSARRDRIMARLVALGLQLSPQSGADLEVLAAQSRLTLNVHLKRSNHLELPRILGAIAARSPVISEASHAMHDVVPASVVAGIGPFRSLAQMTATALRDLPGLQHKADAADNWYVTSYLPMAERQLRDTLKKVAGLPR